MFLDFEDAPCIVFVPFKIALKYKIFRYIIEPRHVKICFMLYANNKHADQPAHPGSLISLFVIHCLDSILPLLAISKLSRL